MLRGAFVCLCVGSLAAAGATQSSAQPGTERGSPTVVTVSIDDDRLRLDFSDGFTSPDIEVDYDAMADEWVVTDPALAAGAGCLVAGLEIRCPEGGEDVRVDFGSTPGEVTLAPAGTLLNFDSRIRMGANSQTIITSDGDDVITAEETGPSSSVADEITTLGGDDEISAGLAPDLIDAGLGDDTVDGGGGDDIISGGAADITGPDGADVLEGGAGTDLVTYASRADDVTAAIGATREDEIAGDVEDLTGGLGSDTLTGDAGPNVLRGGDDGDDTFFGGVGPGPDGADTFRVGGGVSTNIDTVSYANRKDDITADIGGGTDDVDGDDIPADADDLFGGKGDDSLTGDDDDNVLTGGKGEDVMLSLGGVDLINALDNGPDTSNCGDGVDVAKTDVDETESVTACESVDGAPETGLTQVPEKKTTRKKAKFRFTSETPDAMGFECSFDGAPFASCASPQVYNDVSIGRHRFEVRALDDEGDRDPSPAKRRFTRVAK